MTADVAAPYQEEALQQGAHTSSLACSYFSHLFFFSFPSSSLLTLSAFTGADIGGKDPEPMAAEVVTGPTPNV